jgi:hypothetical protein
VSKDSASIYTITGVTEDFPKGRVRNFGWFPFFEEAESAVLNNSCGIDEGGFYSNLVIEECESGVYVVGNYETWCQLPND